MSGQNPTAEEVAREINRVLAEKGSLSNDARLQETLQSIETLDKGFDARGGVFFHTGSNAFETAEKFTEIHVEQYRQTGRPSLPALAVHHAEQLGLDKESPEYKAMIMVAVRAEMEAAVKPDYHSKNHYLDVTAMTANLLEKNNEMVRDGVKGGVVLTKEQQALTLIAAIGHDIDHEGKGNPKDDPLFNEKKSFAVMEPLLREAGLTQAQIDDARTIIMTTSPNGPHAILKTIAEAHRGDSVITVAEIQAKDQAFNKMMSINAAPLDFSELEVLSSNRKLTQMAAMVSDADLYASGGAGMRSNAVMSELLTAEGKKYTANPIDFTTDGARDFFLNGIVGKQGFASNAGREVANDMFEAMRDETKARLAAAKANTAESKFVGGTTGGSKFVAPAETPKEETPAAPETVQQNRPVRPKAPGLG